jgi:hypothetical protein
MEMFGGKVAGYLQNTSILPIIVSSTTDQPRDVLYVRRFLGQLLQRPNGFLQHVRTYVPFATYLLETCPLFSSHSPVL